MFTPDTLTFLRAMKRHNDREWFKARRDQYESVVKAPAVAFVERMAEVLPSFAPEILASPRVSLYRVYRDTRFSADKSPLKTHIGMLFPWRGLPRHEGACFYVEVAPGRTLIAGGIYAPQPKQLRAVRDHIAAHTARFRAIVETRSFRAAFGGLQGDQLSRIPVGFPRDHPAGDYLRFKQFGTWREDPAEAALSPRFFSEVVRRLRQLTPLVCFLNEPLLVQRDASPERFFAQGPVHE
jgi:uncharacterized protein (TIGR02453 family)